MVYVYKTRLCTWVICPNDWEKSGAYIRPDIAADDVAHQATGFYEWDMLPFTKIPSEIEDIGEWQKLKRYP